MKTASDYFDDSDAYLRVLAMENGMDFSRVVPAADPDLLAELTREMALRYHALPVSLLSHGVRVHISDPLDFETLDALRFILKMDVEPVVTPKEILDKAIEEN